MGKLSDGSVDFLERQFAFKPWGQDAAARLAAYDPAAAEVVGISFQPGDRVVITYRTSLPIRGRLTFVIPKWSKPE